MKIESEWRGLVNPLPGNQSENHSQMEQERNTFYKVKVDSKEWAKVVRVGALGKRVIACMCRSKSLCQKRWNSGADLAG